MRIPDLMMNNNSLLSINNSNREYDRMLSKMSSGKNIINSYDDPALAQKAFTLRGQLHSNVQFAKNIRDAKSMTDYSESVLNQASDILVRLKELNIQAGNETITGEARQGIVKEVNELLKEFVNVGNQKFAGKYIFAGTKTTTIPFETKLDADGNIESIKYNGTKDTPKYSIDSDFDMSVNISGDRAFEETFNNLLTLRNDIRDGDLSNISGRGNSNLDKAIDHIVSLRTELGSKSNTLDNAFSKLETSTESITNSHSELMNLNYADAAMKVSLLEVGYQASFSVIGKLQDMSLLKYL